MQSKSNTEALGLRCGVVEVVPYDSRWPLVFEEIAAELRAALGRSILAVHHVGSTSVPNLHAKPVLDVLVAVPNFDEALHLVPDIEALGYVFRRDEEIEDRHFFRRGDDTARTHHLSLATPTSKHYIDTLAFRDALRRDAKLASEYGDLKLTLARRFPWDRESCINGKTDFVMGVLRSVKASAREQLGSNTRVQGATRETRAPLTRKFGLGVQMAAELVTEDVITVGKPVTLEAKSPSRDYAVVFEDDGDTGYRYAVDLSRAENMLVTNGNLLVA